MADILGIAALVGIPFAVFIWAIWRSEERDRKDRRHDGGTRSSRDSYWGGMGRPGR